MNEKIVCIFVFRTFLVTEEKKNGEKATKKNIDIIYM